MQHYSDVSNIARLCPLANRASHGAIPSPQPYWYETCPKSCRMGECDSSSAQHSYETHATIVNSDKGAPDPYIIGSFQRYTCVCETNVILLFYIKKSTSLLVIHHPTYCPSCTTCAFASPSTRFGASSS